MDDVSLKENALSAIRPAQLQRPERSISESAPRIVIDAFPDGEAAAGFQPARAKLQTCRKIISTFFPKNKKQ